MESLWLDVREKRVEEEEEVEEEEREEGPSVV